MRTGKYVYRNTSGRYVVDAPVGCVVCVGVDVGVGVNMRVGVGVGVRVGVAVGVGVGVEVDTSHCRVLAHAWPPVDDSPAALKAVTE